MVCGGRGEGESTRQSEGELSDLYSGRRRPAEYAALGFWHPRETCRLPGAQGKNTEPRPGREWGGKKTS